VCALDLFIIKKKKKWIKKKKKKKKKKKRERRKSCVSIYSKIYIRRDVHRDLRKMKVGGWMMYHYDGVFGMVVSLSFMGRR
jgi:hypothetical protein